MSHSEPLFDSLLEPCFVLDESMKITYCNETASLLSGVSPRKAQKLKLNELFAFEEAPDWFLHLKDVTLATPYKETRFKSSEGNEGKVQITCQRLRAGEDARWLVFLRDVTLEETLQKKYRGELEQKEGYIVELQAAQRELESYSKELEKRVDERTAEIRELNKLMGTLLDSLNEGFFVFDREGRCLDFSSKACLEILETAPNNRPIWEVLKLEDSQVEGFRKWLTTLFSEMLPFEDLAPLGPRSFSHSAGKSIKLEYFPLRNEEGIEAVVVVASDITSLVEAQRQAESERQNALMILNLVHRKQQVGRFIRETQQTLMSLEEGLALPSDGWDEDGIFRAFHTLKGSAASYNLQAMTEAAHEAENALARWKDLKSPLEAEALRGQLPRLKSALSHFLQESAKILGRATASDARTVEMSVADVDRLCRRIDHWTKGGPLAEGLRQKHLYEPVRNFFEAYQEMAQRLALSLGKSLAPLRFHQGDLKVLPEAYQALFTAFVHAIRNAVDHGLETPSERVRSGKPEEGLLEISFEKTEGRLLVRLKDDGRGIDPEKIRERLREKGLAGAEAPDQEVLQRIFDPSFSTRSEVTSISGRGVGLDALKAAARELGGRAFVRSVAGRGTEILVDVPWFESLPRPAAESSSGATESATGKIA